jgi:hypothetical protein
MCVSIESTIVDIPRSERKKVMKISVCKTIENMRLVLPYLFKCFAQGFDQFLFEEKDHILYITAADHV